MNENYIRRKGEIVLKYNITTLNFSIAIIISTTTIFSPKTVFAEEIFNPAFITDGMSNATISDLSKFQNSTHQLPGIYRVEIVANNQYIETKDINFIENSNHSDPTGLFPCLNLSMLDSMGVNVGQYEELKLVENQQCIDFTSLIEGSTSQFIFDKQKLQLTFPQVSLKNQIHGYIPPSQWENGIVGLYTNYYLSGYRNSATNNNSLFLSFTSGFNWGAWQLRNSTNFSYNVDENNSTTKWTHLKTYIQKSIVPIKSQIIIGDGSTNNDMFDAFNYRGINLVSSEAMYPDSQQGYAPTVRGIARTNAKVIIKQNGYLIQQLNVPPGPFVIDDLNPTSVSGDLNVTIEENDGTVQQYTIPYSTLPILQREGRTKYNITVGQFRSGLSSQNTPNVIQATAIQGLKSGISIYTGVQLADHYQSAILGIGSNLGHYGAISVDVTHANSELVDGLTYVGQSIRFLYAKSLINTGTTFRLLGYRYSTKGFYTLSDTAYNKMSDYDIDNSDSSLGFSTSNIINYYNLNHTKKGRLEVNISHAMGKYGSLFVAGNQQSYWGTKKKNQWLQAGYSNSWHGINFSLSVSHSKYMELVDSDTTFTASVSFPMSALFPKFNLEKNLFKNSNITTSTSLSSQNDNSYMTSLNGTLLTGRNLSYNISQGYVDKNHRGSTAVSVGYQGGYGAVSIGYNHDQYNNQLTYSASGSAVIHAHGVTFGQALGDSAILVEVPGAKNIKLENYTGVKTDWRGYAIVPYAAAYRANRIALDSNSFSNNVEISPNVKQVVPIQGAIAKATFTPAIGLRALITIYHHDKYIPYASSVTEITSAAQGYTADDGRTYITGLPVKGVLEARWGQLDSDRCSIPYDLSSMDLTQPIIQFDLACDEDK